MRRRPVLHLSQRREMKSVGSISLTRRVRTGQTELRAMVNQRQWCRYGVSRGVPDCGRALRTRGGCAAVSHGVGWRMTRVPSEWSTGVREMLAQERRIPAVPAATRDRALARALEALATMPVATMPVSPAIEPTPLPSLRWVAVLAVLGLGSTAGGVAAYELSAHVQAVPTEGGGGASDARVGGRWENERDRDCCPSRGSVDVLFALPARRAFSRRRGAPSRTGTGGIGARGLCRRHGAHRGSCAALQERAAD